MTIMFIFIILINYKIEYYNTRISNQIHESTFIENYKYIIWNPSTHFLFSLSKSNFRLIHFLFIDFYFYSFFYYFFLLVFLLLNNLLLGALEVEI